ncbi:arginase family protein [Microbacterium paraoxydans]|uniref:arginase family protein n=1 Tax=Microbacterium paraoxydans TaxID=199592 RepID=UPI001CFB724F|nr:arginase family protein [Microbacterium paraoxydans]
MTSPRTFELIGAPFDGAATLGWPGSRYAPAKIREALGWVTQRAVNGQVYSIETGETLAAPHIIDGGDADVVAHDLTETLANVSDRVAASVRTGNVPILLGGDDSMLFAGTKGLHDAVEGEVAIIHFDAHLDSVHENRQQGRYSQSSGMRRSLELERVNRENTIQIGLRHFSFPELHRFAEAEGPAQITARQFAQIGTDEAVAEILAHIAGAQHVHVSFDIDAIDPAHAPGAGAHEPGGMTSREALEIVGALAPHCDSLTIAEVNPLKDVQDLTVNLAAYLTYYFALFGATRA